MFQRILGVLGIAAVSFVGTEATSNDCASQISWGVTQSATGTCPGSFNQGPGGPAFYSIIGSIVTNTEQEGDCTTVVTPSPSTCTPLSNLGDDDTPSFDNSGIKTRRKKRRRLEDGCIQCSGADDDADDDGTVALDDDDNDGIALDDDDKRRLNSGGSNLGAVLSYTITAGVPNGEDATTVMNNIESDIELYFANEEAAGAEWIARARAMGADIPEDTQVTFSSPTVDNGSVEEVVQPGDFIDQHYHGNSNVRVGTWVAAGVACVGVLVSAMFGMKAYKLKHDADVIEQEKATEWANVDQNAGELTMNPLAGGGDDDGDGVGVRHRSNSGASGAI